MKPPPPVVIHCESDFGAKIAEYTADNIKEIKPLRGCNVSQNDPLFEVESPEPWATSLCV